MNVSIEQLVKWLGIPRWDDFYESNYDYFADKYYVPVVQAQEQLYEEEGLDPLDFQDETEDKALEALSAGEAEEYSNYCSALGFVANELGGQIFVEFDVQCNKGTVEVWVEEDTRAAAQAVVDLINGVGLMSIMSVDDYMEDEGYDSYEQLVLDHVSYIGQIPEVYGDASAERQFYDQMR
ncbi:hypothetical protein LCGC14_0905640 [marine sediment metagenome]|uniref:Uncharacterized protein n=1 Tax=marine sediment metagenome TaxID=412755 RepID=A0A0F9NV62_9ZZZZ